MWHLDQDLFKLSEVLERGGGWQQACTSLHEACTDRLFFFFGLETHSILPQGKKISSSVLEKSGRCWQQLVFPRDSLTPALRPDIVTWSAVEKRAFFIEQQHMNGTTSSTWGWQQNANVLAGKPEFTLPCIMIWSRWSIKNRFLTKKDWQVFVVAI